MISAGLATVVCVGALGAWAPLALGGPPGATPTSNAADPQAAEIERRLIEDIRPLLARSCFDCHGEKKSKADIRFDRLTTITDVLAMADDLATAREMVTTRQMPPEERPRLTDHEILTIQQWIDAARDYYPPDGAIDPGWFTIHRLNRNEYRNTLRDLLGIDPRQQDLAGGLPPDDTGYGFDNIAGVLSMSPLHVEAYLNAAERALDLSLGPVFTISDQPRPIKLAMESSGHELPRGGFLLYTNAGAVGEVEIPVTGEYELTVVSWGTRGGDELPKMSIRAGKRELRGVSVEALEAAPQTDRVRTRLERGPTRLGAYFTNDYYVKDVADRNLAVESMTIAGPLDAATVERPEGYRRVFVAQPRDDSPTSEREAAAAVLGAFASRAYRRPASGGDVERLLNLFAKGRADGQDYESAVRLALSAALVSPNFLYRAVDNPAPDDPAHVYTLDGYELANRLSYFLWSSMPDGPLLAAAADGLLTTDEGLRGQARRMLADPRSRAFIENFAGQWLLLRNLEELAIDKKLFPDYSPELRGSMITEATMFFGDVVRRDLPVTSLIDARYTFVNEPLARLYGLSGVRGKEFRRVDVPEDSPRGGVLTMGAVLTVTSNPTRTSPVKRGLFVLDQILGTPPPPPPPDVPPLEQAKVDSAAKPTLREQLKAHLFDKSCASCHSRMDPLGLALENFNPIGAWRDSYEPGGPPIDASGELPGGEHLAGANELRRVLMQRQGLFIENLTRKLLTYALGRGLEPFDRPTVGAITRTAHEQGDRMSAFIEAIVLSEAFRTCRGTAQ